MSCHLLGIKKVYLSHTWYDIAVKAFKDAAKKGGVRLLYATDTSGIPGRSARMIGIDSHYPGYGITALIMEATMYSALGSGRRLHHEQSVICQAGGLPHHGPLPGAA